MGGYTFLKRSLNLLEQGKQLPEFEKKEPITNPEEYQFDIVIFDNASLTPVTESAFYSSDAMIIPVEMEYFSFEGLYAMNEKLGEVMADMNHELEVLGIIPYNIDGRFKMTHDYSKLIGNDFEAEVTSPIRTDATIKYAQSHAKTVFEYDVNSNAAADFAKLGDEIEQRIQEILNKEARV
jgi:chromosome partitioning protein